MTAVVAGAAADDPASGSGRCGPAEVDDAIAEGADPAFRTVLDQLRRVARSSIRVLLSGPPGVGKTRLAEELHRWSGRRGRLIVVDCAAITSTLFESELFGHTRGAFTGAERDRTGLVAAAEGGTLFLDEVGELTRENQGRLLSFLGSGRYRPVGSTHERESSARVVAASHDDLGARLIPALYGRLAERVIRVPPLSERPDDIVPLAEHLCARWARREGWRPRWLSHEAKVVLLTRPWRDNVRELSAAVHNALLEAEADRARELMPRHFGAAPVPLGGGWEDRLDAILREVLRCELRAARWNVAEVARRLGLHRQRVHERMRELGIERPR